MTSSPFHEFDDDVVRAMARWPDVPQCFGWLRLDRRGHWRIKDAVISHQRAVAFLSRHYRADDDGRWYVQNGPQQVFVTLDYTPWVFRHDGDARFTSHTGVAAGALRAAWLDDEGNLLLEADTGIGLVDDRDLSGLLAFIDDSAEAQRLRAPGGDITIGAIARRDVAARFRFEPDPRADAPAA